MNIAKPFLPYKIETTPKRLNVTAHGGLPLVLEAMRVIWPKSCCRRLAKALHYKSWKTVRRHVESLVLLIAAGGCTVDDPNILSADEGLTQLLGFELSSPSRAKELLYKFDQSENGKFLLRSESAALSRQGHAFILPEGPGLQVLGEMLAESVAHLQRVQPCKTLTLDAGATIVESHKATALYHYEKSRGYQPMMGMWAEQMAWLKDEFRDGNVGSDTGLLEFVQKAAAAAPKDIERFRFRADSAFYNGGMLTWLDEHDWMFAVSAVMSEDLVKKVKTIPEAEWVPYRPGEGAPPASDPAASLWSARISDMPSENATEVRECAEVPDFVPNWKRSFKEEKVPFRYVAIRVRSRQGDLLRPVSEQWKHFAVVTNHREISPSDILVWHRTKRGTVEHGHGDAKNELAGGKLPAARFGANAAWWRLNAVCHNLLLFLKVAAHPVRMHPMRPKALRFHLFNLPGLVLRHARTTITRLSKCHPGAALLAAAREKLKELWQRLQMQPTTG